MLSGESSVLLSGVIGLVVVGELLSKLYENPGAGVMRAGVMYMSLDHAVRWYGVWRGEGSVDIGEDSEHPFFFVGGTRQRQSGKKTMAFIKHNGRLALHVPSNPRIP